LHLVGILFPHIKVQKFLCKIK